MSRDSDTQLRAQVLSEIREAADSCRRAETRSDDRAMDYEELHDQLTRVMQNAVFQGLREREFLDLVRSELPAAWERLRFLACNAVRRSA